MKIVRPFVFGCVVAAGTTSSLAQPANDGCGGAASVVDGDNPINTASATFDTANPCSTDPSLGDGPNADVWYSYAATETGLRTFEITNDPFGGYGFSLSVYDGCGGTLLKCDYLGSGRGNYMSKVHRLPVTAGVVYKIHVAGVFGASGAGALRISAPPAPSSIAGDECSNAIVVTGQPATAAFNTAGMTLLDPQAWDMPMTADGWFAWTPSVSGIGYVSGCGFIASPAGAVSPRLSVQEGCNTIPLTYFSNFRETSTSTSACLPTACFEAIAGRTYHIRYSGDNARNISGSMQFEVRPREGGGISIPAGAIAEPGNCDDTAAADVNGGCFVSPASYTPYQLCEVVSGTASSRKSTIAQLTAPVRLAVDTDFYEFTLATDQTVTVTGQSEFPPLARILATCDSDPFGNGGIVIKQTVFRNDCSGVYDLNRSGSPASAAPFTVDLVAGTYFFAVSPLVDGYSSSTCGTGDRYWFKITGSEPCPPRNEQCCRGTTCTTVAAGACTGASNGTIATPTTNCGGGNTVAGCCFADYTKTNGVNIDDIFVYLNAWFASSPYAKFNGDGVVTPTIDDIFIYLNAWFTGCA